METGSIYAAYSQRQAPLGAGLLGAWDDDHDAGEEERGQQLVDAPDAAELADEEIPDEHHRAARDHARDGARIGGALPEQREEHQRAERRAARPGEVHDREDHLIFTRGDKDRKEADQNQHDAGRSSIYYNFFYDSKDYRDYDRMFKYNPAGMLKKKPNR